MYGHITTVVLLWAVYFFLHSLLATSDVKTRFKTQFPNQAKYYRLAYTTISVFGLLPIIYYLAYTPSSFFFERTTAPKFIALWAISSGVFVLRAAFRTYDIRVFIGIKYQNSKSSFVRNGVLNYVRHPIYTATILITVGFWLLIPSVLSLVTSICFFVYLAIGIWLEEKKLIEEFGDRYIQFRKEVPMLFPKISVFFNKEKPE